MGTQLLFPFAEYWWFYLSFTGVVVLLLLLDLGIFHRNAHEVSLKEATLWSIFWIALALLFNWGFYHYLLWRFDFDPKLNALFGYDGQEIAKKTALQFLAGYLVEKSLSVDNLFVFVMIFSYFGIQPRFQRRILFYGIVGALFFRAIFIAAGSILMQFHLIVVLFGIFLIYTGLKMMLSMGKEVHPGRNFIIRLLRRLFPVTGEINGQKLFCRKNNRIFATPMFVALLAIETSDIVFAFDSVPAIFALTKEPLIVFTSNIFAILGLRALYFMLAAVIDKFHLLKYGLGIVLIFVGLKMVWLNDYFNGEFPISISLSIIGGIITASVLLSLLFPIKAKEPVVVQEW